MKQANAGLLSGVRILELGRVFAAPFATQLLADMGAEVIKIEHPRGDESRTYGPPFVKNADGHDTDESAYYVAANRNKKSVTVDFNSEEGRQAIRELAMWADVLVENFKVGDLKRYGLDYDTLGSANPKLIYCSVTGFGQTGPYAHRGGLDSVVQALSGLMSLTGDPDGEPQKVGMIVDDFVTGLYGALGIVAALRHRDLTDGIGQYLDLSLFDAAIAFLGPRGVSYLLSGEEPVRTGNASFGSAPAQLFMCSDTYLMVQAGSDAHFRKLCVTLGIPELADDPRFLRRSDRARNLDELLVPLNKIFLTKSAYEWAEMLAETGIPQAPVNTVSQAFADPQAAHRQMVRRVPHKKAGEVSLIANPLRFSKTPIDTYRAPPEKGEHTNEILGGLLGMDEASIKAASGNAQARSSTVEARISKARA
jgi:crotonobetainyl-CoA:carnitine CoA-transferase CaiB-like acyl-CoA transferase